MVLLCLKIGFPLYHNRILTWATMVNVNKCIHSCFTLLPSTAILNQHILATLVFLLFLQHTFSIPSSGLCKLSILFCKISFICHIRWINVTGLGNQFVVCLFFSLSDTQMTRERDSQFGLYAASVHETLERLLDKVTFSPHTSHVHLN